MSNDDVGLVLSEDYKNYLKYRKHLPGGWSKEAKCSLMNYFSQVYKIYGEPQGTSLAGTLGHEEEQRRNYIGKIIMNRYEVCAHEQLVRIDDGTARGRRSSIDTLVYDLKEERYTTWDYKFVQQNVNNIIEPFPGHIEQSNLFAYALKKNFNLSYNPKFTIIYISNFNHLNRRSFTYELDLKMARKKINQMLISQNLLLTKKRLTRESAIFLADGLKKEHKMISKIVKHSCKYCDYVDKCAEIIGFDYSDKKWLEKEIKYYAPIEIEQKPKYKKVID